MAERGVILEIEGRYAVVLVRGGEFRRVRLDRPGRRVGEEIALPPTRRLPVLLPVTATVAAAALLALAVLPAALRPGPGGPAAPPAAVSPGAPGDAGAGASAEILAYVTVDINPSVELAVDGAGTVVAARALNGDGESLLAQVPAVGRPVAEVIADLAAAAARRGFLAAGQENAVVIATVPAPGHAELPEPVRRQVADGRQRVEAALAAQALPVQVGVLDAGAPQLKEEAEQAGLSLGKYLILLEARRDGIPVTAAEVRERPIGLLFRDKGVKPGEVIRRAEQEEDFPRLAASLGPAEDEGRDDGATGPGLTDDAGGAGVTPGGGREPADDAKDKKLRRDGGEKKKDKKRDERRSPGDDEGGSALPGAGDGAAGTGDGGGSAGTGESGGGTEGTGSGTGEGGGSLGDGGQTTGAQPGDEHEDHSEEEEEDGRH